MKKELDVVAALIREDSKILLCQRNQDDHYANLWEFPGGTVEQGESHPQALAREMAEELGVEVKVDRLLGEFFDEDENLKIKVFLFYCKIERGSLSAKDCQNFGFFSFAQAKNLNLAPVDKKIYGYLSITLEEI
jgi:(d)CTP diphosphatase|tara:strand:- start:22 stop:423 length:402 start_codon:yes stop_codon:yes gene_type:complete